MHKWNIPKHELESLARVFLPAIRAYFETEEGKAEYEKWENEQRTQEATRKDDSKSN